ncbi:hypothetical protein DVH05_003649 [Phytophthora capsici]|nr:hypothetical protein DVH05_003649 [Phytophthora capsici]
MIVAKLQDVEQQLLHATQVVQLHVRLADAHKSSKNATDGNFDGETEILELIDRVERAERDLQNVTTQLLALAKCCITAKDEEHEGMYQSDNLENRIESSVAEEKPEEEEGEGEETSRSSLEKYTAAAKNAVKMVVDPEDAETLEAWRRIVEVDALDANRQFLDLLNEGKVEKESAEAFSKATSFAVSVLTSYQAMSQKPSWLMQLVEDLTGIENAAKQSKFAKVLVPVEKCRDDLVAYCSRTDCDTLEAMLNYVILIERHRGVRPNQLLPFMLTLLRRFIGDCTDYQLRQDVVGEEPRMDSEWMQFTQVGKSLANWMQVLWAAGIKCSKVDALLVSSHFREFEIRFPGRLPAELHENWCQIIGEAGQRKLNEYAAKLESLDRTNDDELLRGDKEISVSEMNSVPVKEIPASEMSSVPDPEFPNTDVPVIRQLEPLEKFISDAKNFQSKLEEVVPETPVIEKQRKELITRFSHAMIYSLSQAHNDLCARVAAGKLDPSLAIGFDEAVAFTVSLITVYEKNTLQHARIREMILALYATYEIGSKSRFTEPFEHLRGSINALMRYCDERCLDCFDGVNEIVKAIASTIPRKDTRHLQELVLKLGEQFRSVIAYAMVRQKMGYPLRWQQEAWQRFNDIGLVLSHCVKRVGMPLLNWRESVKAELISLAAVFPGKMPEPLQTFYINGNTRKRFAAAIARINRGTVSGAKRARTEPDTVVNPPKRANAQSNLSGDRIHRVIERKLYDHLREGQLLLNICSTPDPKNATQIQMYLVQAKTINIEIGELLQQGKLSQRARETFDVAIKTIASIIWRSPVEYFTSRVVKNLLDQCTNILRVLSTAKQDQSSLTESCKSLQKYWRVHFGDAIVTMRRFIAETNSIEDLNQLAPRARQLAIFYRNACDALYDELNGIVPFSRKTQIREELTKIGTVLNDWVQRLLAAKIYLRGLMSAFDIDMKINRMLDVLPDSAPTSLAKNLRQVFGVPEPRALRVSMLNSRPRQ